MPKSQWGRGSFELRSPSWSWGGPLGRPSKHAHLPAENLETLPGTHTSAEGKDHFSKNDSFPPPPTPGGGSRGGSQEALTRAGARAEPVALLEVKHGVGELQREVGEEGDPELVKASLDVRVEHQGSIKRGTEASGGGQKRGAQAAAGSLLGAPQELCPSGGLLALPSRQDTVYAEALGLVGALRGAAGGRARRGPRAIPRARGLAHGHGSCALDSVARVVL